MLRVSGHILAVWWEWKTDEKEDPGERKAARAWMKGSEPDEGVDEGGGPCLLTFGILGTEVIFGSQWPVVSFQWSLEFPSSLGKRFSCRVAKMQDDHIVSSNVVKNEIISNGHHPVLEIVERKRKALWEILQRKTGEIQF